MKAVLSPTAAMSVSRGLAEVVRVSMSRFLAVAYERLKSGRVPWCRTIGGVKRQHHAPSGAEPRETTMTITDTNETASDLPALAEFDLYRDIHKGIRGLLFSVASRAGQTDPGDRLARLDLAERVDGMIDFLVA